MDSPQFEQWQRNTRVAITNTFGNELEHITDFNNIRFSFLAVPSLSGPSDSEYQTAYEAGLESAVQYSNP